LTLSKALVCTTAYLGTPQFIEDKFKQKLIKTVRNFLMLFLILEVLKKIVNLKLKMKRVIYNKKGVPDSYKLSLVNVVIMKLLKGTFNTDMLVHELLLLSQPRQTDKHCGTFHICASSNKIYGLGKCIH
jgi:hypothetical protein